MLSDMPTLSGKSILITGGAGFIGSHLADRVLIEEPRKLVIVDNFFLGKEENLLSALEKRPDLEIIRLDASNFVAMQDVVAKHKIEIVFDLAVIPLPTSLLYPNWTIATNIGIASTFCELARLEQIEYLLHLSSSEAYGSAKYIPMDEEHPHAASTPYACSKSAADLIIQSYVKTFNINATIVRPFNNFGPRQNPGSYAGIIPIVISNVRNGRPIEIFGDGEQTRDFTFVSQTADLVVKISKDPKCYQDVFNVATGVETSINQLVSELLNVMGKPYHPVRHLPPRMADVRRHCADVTKTQSTIGAVPVAMNLTQLQATVDWYMRNS